jgi:hypothetical protein
LMYTPQFHHHHHHPKYEKVIKTATIILRFCTLTFFLRFAPTGKKLTTDIHIQKQYKS